MECETLKHDLKAVMQRLEASREIQAKLEMETHQQADELDIAKDKVCIYACILSIYFFCAFTLCGGCVALLTA